MKDKFGKVVFFIAILWVVRLLDYFLPFLHLNNYGIYPRKLSGLLGIFTSVFLHGSFEHLISNTLPLFILLLTLITIYPRLFSKVVFLCIIMSGSLVWIFARNACHIGASNLIYGLSGFCIVSGFLRRDMLALLIAILMISLYGGSIIFGVFPVYRIVSWESHLFGLLSGIYLSWKYRRIKI